MYCHISFSAESFERLIKYRAADSFRPLAAPVDFPAMRRVGWTACS
jgi:hypothetical protein